MGRLNICLDKFPPQEHKQNEIENTWINNAQRSLSTKEKLFQKRIDKQCEETRKQCKKIRNTVTKEIRDARSEHNYKLLGDNPSAKKLYYTLKIQRAKSQTSFKTPDVNT